MFKNGDVVCLKSGGAKMTVQAGICVDENMVAVVWCDAAGVPHREYFLPDMLVKARDEAAGAPFTLRKGQKVTGLEMLQNPAKRRFYLENKDKFSTGSDLDPVVYNGPDGLIQY